LLVNIYLHYALDNWAACWQRTHARGYVKLMRFADDVVVCFQSRTDADRFLQEGRERLAKFRLELHPEKTRLLEFGRFAAQNRRDRGETTPETFNFLGFTHICSTTRKGRFCVLRISKRIKVQAKVQEIKHDLRRRISEPLPIMGTRLGQVLRGHSQYYGVPRKWLPTPKIMHPYPNQRVTV
jgi:hypothetical protein